MKILIVTGIFPPDHGGPASYVPSIAGALAGNHSVAAVVTLSDNLEHDDSGYAFPVIRIRRGLWRGLRVLKTVATIWQLARAADIVYLNGLVLEGMVASKLILRRPVVIKVVGDLVWERARNQAVTDDSIEAFQRHRHPLKWQLLRILQGWYMRLADVVIVPSEYLARIVSGWGVDQEKIAVAYNAVHVPPDSAVEPTWDLVTVTRLVAWKGVDQLVQLAARNGWSLKIVGDGPLRASLESLAQNVDAGNKVSFVGHVPQAEVVRHIRSGRVFVLNSSYEGLPHIVLEAKAAGVAVVATAVGGTAETINDRVDGFLFSAGDTAALTRILQQLLGDSAMRRAIADRAKVQVAQRFSFNEMVAHTERLLTRAAFHPADLASR